MTSCRCRIDCLAVYPKQDGPKHSNQRDDGEVLGNKEVTHFFAIPINGNSRRASTSYVECELMDITAQYHACIWEPGCHSDKRLFGISDAMSTCVLAKYELKIPDGRVESRNAAVVMHRIRGERTRNMMRTASSVAYGFSRSASVSSRVRSEWKMADSMSSRPQACGDRDLT